MATIKVACPKCGQKVSGDESFFGTTVECPVCSSDIVFPPVEEASLPPGVPDPVPAREEQPVAAAKEPETETPIAMTPAADAEPVAESGGEPPSPVWGAVSLVSAVLGVVTCVGGMLFSPLAIIFGHLALGKARRSTIQPAPGQNLATIGMLVGYIWLGITILVLVLAILFKQPLSEFIGSATS